MKLLIRLSRIIILAPLLFSSIAFSDEKMNTQLNTNTEESALVKKAILASETCYHWAGEAGDQTAERNREIAAGVERDCPPAKKLMEEAFTKYPNNRGLYVHALYLYDSGHMNLTTLELKRLCSLVKDGAGC